MFEHRIKHYQQNYIAVSAQRSHEEFAVNLRKSKRYIIEKKRRQCYSSETSLLLPASISSYFPQIEKSPDLEKLFFLKSCLVNSPSKSLTIEILSFVNLVASSDAPPLDLIVSSNITQQIVLYLNLKYELEIIQEATCILCDLASGSSFCIENLCENGCIEAFLIVLDCRSAAIKENALSGLSNIIANSQEHFELVLASGFIKKLSKICKFQDSFVLYHTISWTLKNISFYIDKLTPHQVLQLVEIAAKLITSEDKETIKDTLSAIALISSESYENTDLLYESKLVDAILSYLPEFPISVLTTCGNICTGTSQHIMTLLGKNILDLIYPYFSCDNSEVIEYIYLVLSNIVTGGVDAINQVMDHVVFQTSIMCILQLEEISRVKAGYYVSNLMKLGSKEVQIYLIEHRIDEILNSFCQVECRKTQNHVLDICEIILKLIGAQEFLFRGCGDALYCLSMSREPNIKERAIHIIEAHIELD